MTSRTAIAAALCLTACASSPPESDLLTAPGAPEDPAWTSPRAGDPDAGDTLRVTLERAVELALGRPAARAADERVLAAEAASRQARAWRNPEAVLEIEGFGGDRPGLDESEITVGMAGGIDLFGRAGASGKVADAELQEERARRLATRRDLAARVRRAFHEALAAGEELAIADMLLAVTRETANAVRSEVEAGKTAPLRGIQAEASLETARVRHEAAGHRLDLARAHLSRLLRAGVSRPGPTMALGRLRASFPPVDPESLAAGLLAGHPDVVRDRWRAETQHRRAGEIGRKRWPELGVSIGYRRDRAVDRSDWVGGLSVELPLFDRRQGAVREARRLESAAREDAREEALRLLDELERAVVAGRAAASLLDRYDAEILPRAGEALRLARLGYSEGKFGYLDLTGAEESLVRSRAERARALIDLDRALTDLEILAGRTLSPSSESRED